MEDGGKGGGGSEISSESSPSVGRRRASRGEEEGGEVGEGFHTSGRPNHKIDRTDHFHGSERSVHVSDVAASRVSLRM